jgi:xanthine/CO dehydrogenase XdhC/CoxF family maturation factor
VKIERSILDAARAGNYERAALVTLMTLEGSGYRKPGACMLVTNDGASRGSVTGGCLEATVVQRALQAMQSDDSVLFTVDTMLDADAIFGYGLGCAGRLGLLIEPFGPDHLPASLRNAEPPRTMIVAGAGNDAQPLVRIASAAEWEVTLVDHRAAWATRERFPDARQIVHARPESLEVAIPEAVVLMTHNVLLDLEYAKYFAAASYIGVVGSRKRFAWLRQELAASGAPLANFHGPAGLDIGSESPAEIALSILAQTTNVLTERTCLTSRS